MGIVELLLLAVGVSMDAFAVSICKGLAMKKATLQASMTCGLWFGGFQALMPTIGFFLGTLFAEAIQTIDHWVAFVLLAIIGINMLKEAFSCDCDCCEEHNADMSVICNFDVNDGVVSRFGFDIESDDFKKALTVIAEHENLYLIGLQCHFATRALHTWRPRAEGMLSLIEDLGILPEHIDLGGGLFGKMADSLKAQFDSEIPSYRQYAEAVAPVFAEKFKNSEKKPMLLIEPGSALVGDCMHFASRVVNIKNVRGKHIATLLGSIYNINPTLNKKNPPIEVISMGNAQSEYVDLDFGGFTCIESDYLYRHYNGNLAKGDMVVFGNVGSYSVVLKPPFILPNFPIIDISEGQLEIIKRGESFDDLFHTFNF